MRKYRANFDSGTAFRTIENRLLWRDHVFGRVYSWAICVGNLSYDAIMRTPLFLTFSENEIRYFIKNSSLSEGVFAAVCRLLQSGVERLQCFYARTDSEWYYIGYALKQSTNGAKIFLYCDDVVMLF